MQKMSALFIAISLVTRKSPGVYHLVNQELFDAHVDDDHI